MKRIVNILLPGIVCVAVCGCIRETLPPCPSLSITLTVKDKNYFNIDDAAKLGLMERRVDTLPFRAYVHSLYYVLHDADGGVVAEHPNARITNDDPTQRIELPDNLPYGKYTLTVWGNMEDETALGEDATQAGMESEATATNDIYLASATFDYRYGNETYTLGLERTKGSLLIKAEGLPDNIDFSTKNIEGVYGQVDNGFTYSAPTSVQTALDWTVQNDIQTQTLMCPSELFERSTLNIVFFDKSLMSGGSRSTLQPSLSPQDISITMGRNEITILRYVYQESESGSGFDIYLRVNGNWELLHEMSID